jgi:hypothetical protein
MAGERHGHGMLCVNPPLIYEFASPQGGVAETNVVFLITLSIDVSKRALSPHSGLFILFQMGDKGTERRKIFVYCIEVHQLLWPVGATREGYIFQ